MLLLSTCVALSRCLVAVSLSSPAQPKTEEWSKKRSRSGSIENRSNDDSSGDWADASRA